MRLWNVAIVLVVGLGVTERTAFAGLPESAWSFEKIADFSSPTPPAGSGPFTALGDEPSMSDGNVAFSGTGGNPSRTGIYSSINGLSLVADQFTNRPGGGGTFGSFGTSPPTIRCSPTEAARPSCPIWPERPPQRTTATTT